MAIHEYVNAFLAHASLPEEQEAQISSALENRLKEIAEHGKAPGEGAKFWRHRSSKDFRDSRLAR